jgi:hypothetical protein
VTEIYTSNQLSPIYGMPPTTQLDASKIERGFVIYLEILGPTGKLFARTFWTKYGHEGAPGSQKEFVSKILELANEGKLENIPLSEGPLTKDSIHAFRDDISEIKFGWKPINVSYVLNTPYVEFQPVDTSKPLQQPLVFRHDKVVKGMRQTYLPNHSFFNLTSYRQEEATILEFSNFMFVDADRTFIGEAPTDVTEMENKYFPYCLDIPMDFQQEKIFNALFPLAVTDSDGGQSPGAGLLNTITFVFDPPQGNGGGGGVPTYP